MADAIFALILFYSFVLGARRGFYKEVVNIAALVVSIGIARELRVPLGAKIHGTAGLPVMLSEVVAVVVVWVCAFFVAAVVGRLILKKLRGHGIDDELEDGAEDLADALAGDTVKGPVTLLTDPIASKTGIFYWSDKLLGAGLGLAKGFVTAYLLFGILVWADRSRGWESSMVDSYEASYADRLFQAQIQPHLETFAEYKIVRSLGQMRGVAEAVKQDPRRFAAFAEHPELKGLRNDPRITALSEDPDVRKAWLARDLKGLLLNEKVRDLLADPALRERIAEVDWGRVQTEVEQTQPLSAEEAAKSLLEGAMGDDGAPSGSEAAAEVPDVPEAPALPSEGDAVR